MKKLVFSRREREKMVNLYKNFKRVEEISVIMRCSRSVVYRILREEECLDTYSIRMKKLYDLKKIVVWNKGKKVPQMSGENHPMYGKKLSDDIKKRISEYNKNNPNRYWLGKKRPDSSKRMKEKNPMRDPRIVQLVHNKMDWKTRRRFKDKKFREEWIIKMRDSNKKNPNNPEKEIIKIIKKYNLHFRYVGDGNCWIRGKGNCFNPDFLHKSKKIIIEVFGDYWHNREDAKERDAIRFQVYIDNGYNVLIIWENQAYNEKEVVDKIKSFEYRYNPIKFYNPITPIKKQIIVKK